jgi:hypothetical protein
MIENIRDKKLMKFSIEIKNKIRDIYKDEKRI